MAGTKTERMDADAYIARGETDRREELIGGQIIVSQPTWRHQVVAARLVAALLNWSSRAPGRGVASNPVDLRLSDWDVLAPDIVWYADPGRVSVDGPAQLEPPDLVIEIRSPSTWVRDIGVKRRLYEEHGIRELWLVDPRAPALLVFRCSDARSRVFDVEIEFGIDDALISPAMPGLAISVRELLTV